MKRYVKTDSIDPLFDDSKAFSSSNIDREQIAQLTKSTELLSIYALDPDRWVRYAAAGNKHMSVEDLDILAHDNWSAIREVVAQNKSTSADTLAYLAGDIDGSVLASVAQNPNTTSDTLFKLLGRSSYITARILAKRKLVERGLL